MHWLLSIEDMFARFSSSSICVLYQTVAKADNRINMQRYKPHIHTMDPDAYMK